MGDDLKYYLSLILGLLLALYIFSQDFQEFPPLNKGVVVDSDCPQGTLGLAVPSFLGDNRRKSIALTSKGVACVSVPENAFYLKGSEVFWIISKDGSMHVIGLVEALEPEESI